MPAVEIKHGDVVRDVFFDNIVTDMKFHEEIKGSRLRVERASTVVDDMYRAANERVRVVGEELKRKEGEAREAREALQKAREEAFRRVKGGGGGGEGKNPFDDL